MRPSRRQTLRALGLSIAATEGCLDADESGPGGGGSSPLADAPTLSPGDSYETDDGRTIKLSAPSVRPSVVTVEYVSSTHYYERVTDAGSDQYVSFEVAVTGFDLPTERSELYANPIDIPLAVDVDGERYTDTIPVGRDDDAYRDHVAIKVPVVDADRAALVWAREDGPQPRWQLGTDVRETLRAAPDFAARGWTVPDRVESGDALEVSVTVENTGDRDGRFLTTLGVKLGSVGLPETSIDVPAGETRTLTRTLQPEYYESELRVVLDWGAGRRTASVEVVD